MDMIGRRNLPTSEEIISCPNCKKPLPRCSICLMPFSCTFPSVLDADEKKFSRQMDDWFEMDEFFIFDLNSWSYSGSHGVNLVGMVVMQNICWNGLRIIQNVLLQDVVVVV
jgi:hypothetical protein